MWKGRFPTALDQGVPSIAALSDMKAIYTTGSRIHKKDKERQAFQDSALDGLALDMLLHIRKEQMYWWECGPQRSDIYWNALFKQNLYRCYHKTAGEGISILQECSPRPHKGISGTMEKQTHIEERDYSRGSRYSPSVDQPMKGSLWQTPQTQTTSTLPATKTKPQYRGLQPIRWQGRLHRTINPSKYKTPIKQRSIEEHTQRTPPEGGAPEEQCGKDDKAKAATSNPQRRRAVVAIEKAIVFNFLHVSPRVIVENASVDNQTHNNTWPNKWSPTRIE